MLGQFTVICIALVYVGLLFLVASYADRRTALRARGQPRPGIYALSMGIYCTSWTFFGSVGVAARSGFDFLPIYIGPILLLVFGWPVLQRIVEISKRQNITSVADFLSARYGKNQVLGASVALIAAIGVVPYIALQLKAVAAALQTMMAPGGGLVTMAGPAADDLLALFVALALGLFAMLFGTRHIDATEHQDGMILAVAVESVVKLIAFLTVGGFVTFALMGGPSALYAAARTSAAAEPLFAGTISPAAWITMTVLSICAFLLLPRQFHVAVVENSHLSDVRRAAWIFPAYLIAINIFVLPIAAAGLVLFGSATQADSFVLAIPVARGSVPAAIMAFIGGLSAATAMVIVETVALAIMLCNDVALPLLVRLKGSGGDGGDMGRLVIRIRRTAIVIILGLAFLYYESIGNVALAQIGLISFAAIAQIAPAFFAGLVWRGGTARGALAGILTGFVFWTVFLLLPQLMNAPQELAILGLDGLSSGVLLSLGGNLAVFVIVSLTRAPSAIERVQASLFISPGLTGTTPNLRLWRTTVSTGQLMDTVARYLGEARTHDAFRAFATTRHTVLDPAQEADVRTMRFAEHLLASAVGAASSRLIIGLLLERHARHKRGAVRLLDEASAAIQHNRDLMQSAIDNVGQGIAVFNANLQLIFWNRQFGTLLALTPELTRSGVSLAEMLQAIEAGPTRIDDTMAALVIRKETVPLRLTSGATIEIHASDMPDGGLAVTAADVTERALAAEALERRVAERTAELTKLNIELASAKVAAEEANLGKTRFIAAASHDILQPLNAARLFTSSLVERLRNAREGELVRNVDASLEAVEQILNALLDISRLDAGAMRTDIREFPISEIFEALQREFDGPARAKGLHFTVSPSTATVRSDPRLLRRVLQNLVSNAIKYTQTGRVLMGCRRVNGALRIEVHDTGLGIPENRQAVIFREFERLAQSDSEPGLGLGLSIVERIAQMLDHPITLRSREAKGSMFAVTVPRGANLSKPRPEAAPLKPRSAPQLAGARVLVADNEAAILEGMRSLLSGWACDSVLARSLAEAVSLMQTGPKPDIILADYHLHREDGLALIARLRDIAGLTLPAILITADRSPGVIEQCAQQDVIYLRKPVKPAALRAAMNRALSRATVAT